MLNHLSCPICNSSAALYDVVDFNKICHEINGKRLSLSGLPIYYALCNQCGFCYAPEIAAWSMAEFSDKIYNQAYIEFDPDYEQIRPKANAANLIKMFGAQSQHIRHLDYGGGDGLLANTLTQAGWQSTSYDPFVNQTTQISTLGQFDLITAYEVFEHVPDPQKLMQDLSALLKPNGIILLSTLLSDGHIHPNEKLTWWYAAPRNGHISLFSKKSLTHLASLHQLKFGSFSAGLHIFMTNLPEWAKAVIQVS